ncbi:sensor of ECF-type sigma factor [Hyunsoonleella sp. 2307UL5-6]|uniref:sensor of ECF-type sigma factor n=1 Tax=Hyunsoonleella sp. 2307UL5-6 TaxID=3384768 RepID=UPI0039BD0326
MKKLLCIIVVMISMSALAQRGDKRERIKALKVAFITEQLDLTTEESQVFWPIYNTFEKETNTIRFKEIKDIRKEIRDNLDTMTDTDASTLIKRLNKAENRMHELRLGLSDKLKNVIPAKKIIRLKIAEDDFRRKILNEFKRRKRERP